MKQTIFAQIHISVRKQSEIHMEEPQLKMNTTLMYFGHDISYLNF